MSASNRLLVYDQFATFEVLDADLISCLSTDVSLIPSGGGFDLVCKNVSNILNDYCGNDACGNISCFNEQCGAYNIYCPGIGGD